MTTTIENHRLTDNSCGDHRLTPSICWLAAFVEFMCQVASATAAFVVLYSSSLSVVEFYFLKRFPIPYVLYLMSVSILAGFWGQFLVRKLVTYLGRTSIIVFIWEVLSPCESWALSKLTIFLIQMIQDHVFKGFLDFL